MRVAVAEERGASAGHDVELLAAVRRMHEQNPMLGPARRAAGPGRAGPVRHAGPRRSPRRPRWCRPRAATPGRRSWCRSSAPCRSWRPYAPRPSRCSARCRRRRGVAVDALIGTMIEVPRAALTAGQIAQAAEFFSFGTNDLTQIGWGFSRDDVEGSFFSRYLELGIFGVSPFETIDRDGRRPAGPHRRRGGPRGPTRPEDRRLRRARRRPRLGALLPRGRPGLRLLLAVPGAGGPPGGGPGRPGRGRHCGRSGRCRREPVRPAERPASSRGRPIDVAQA